VIAKAKEVLAGLPAPGWAKALFGNDVVLGMLVDLLVATLNRTGKFFHGNPPDLAIRLTPLPGGAAVEAGVKF
jgi:hypothetical protein